VVSPGTLVSSLRMASVEFSSCLRTVIVRTFLGDFPLVGSFSKFAVVSSSFFIGTLLWIEL
jgi:hypothetical protein